MKFEEIDSLAKKGDPLPKESVLEERMCALALRYLYSEYRRGNLQRGQAKKEKEDLHRDFEKAVQDRYRIVAMYCQYQENIRRCQLLKTEITKGARDGMGMDALLERAVCCIAVLTHDEVFARLVMERLRERTGKAP